MLLHLSLENDRMASAFGQWQRYPERPFCGKSGIDGKITDPWEKVFQQPDFLLTI